MTTTGSSFFNKAASDPSALGEKYTGPNYVYSKWIKSPTEMGMSGGGSLDDLADNCVRSNELHDTFNRRWWTMLLKPEVKI